MASKEAIQIILQAEYNSTRWKAFLSELFTSSSFYSNPTPLTGINTSVASQALHIGNITLNDNGISHGIAVYEVKLAENVVLERNRVGLRNLLKPHWNEQDAAFIVYYHPQNKSWRFSYVSELKTFNEAGEYVDNKTAPKRYTYVLGENESCHTAALQFSKLLDKASNATLDDIKEAFSVEKMSKEFFDTYKDHYQDFVQFLTGKRLEKVSGKWEEVVKHAPNTQLITIFNNNEKDVRDFCKKLLGRIVFLYFIQKKGWLGVPLHDKWGNGKPDFISRLLANCRNPSIFYSEYLSKLFFETLNQPRPDDIAEIIPGEKTRVPYLNGGLFEEDDPNQRGLIFEAELFKDLFAFFDQYNFTIYEDDPNDHTVAVDPEMLGHIFENLLEDNKDKGAFYTPKEIVHYMCQESLIEYLSTWFEGQGYTVQQDSFVSFDNPAQTSFISANDGRTGQSVLEIAQTSQQPTKHINRSIIEKLLKKQLSDDDKQAVIEEAENFNRALDDVKICDPAIGSGAFPMGLLLEVFTAKQTIHTFTHSDLTTFEPAKVKLNIIQNSIYGVDIECGAVDIARLRFWLSLVVDEPEPQPLPNLDYKIVVGNSLISKLGDDVIEVDWDVKKQVTQDMFGVDETSKIKQTLTELNQLQKAFFNPKSDKKALTPKIRNLKIDLLTHQLNLMIETRGLKVAPRKMATQTQKDFVAQTERYLETQGWLAQIRQLQTLKTQPHKTLDFFDWQLNFAEVMNKEVNETDKVGFDIVIGNPPWVSMKGKHGIEESKRNNLEELMIKYAGNTYMPNLFEFFIKKGLSLLTKKGSLVFIIPDRLGFNSYFAYLRQEILTQYQLKDIIYKWDFETIIADTMTLIIRNESLLDYKIAIKTRPENDRLWFSKSEILSSEYFEFRGFENKLIQALVNKINSVSEPLNRHAKSTSGFGGNSKKIHEIKTHANQIEIVKGRGISRYGKIVPNYFEFKDENLSGRTRDENKLGKKEKILLRKTGDTLIATYDSTGIYPEQSLYFLYDLKVSPKHILAVINSRLLNWYYLNRLVTNEDSTPQLKNFDLDNIPIAKSIFNCEIICRLVDEIINGKNCNIDTLRKERSLDFLIYKLYSLSFDEIKIIEPYFDLSEAEYNSIEI